MNLAPGVLRHVPAAHLSSAMLILGLNIRILTSTPIGSLWFAGPVRLLDADQTTMLTREAGLWPVVGANMPVTS